jgi:parvulin-like peptidyl-prolyl isomerase
MEAVQFCANDLQRVGQLTCQQIDALESLRRTASHIQTKFCARCQVVSLISAGSSRLFKPELLELLAQYRMIKPLLRQMVIAELADQVPTPDEAGGQALAAFMREQGIETEEQLTTFLRLNLLQRHELERQLLQPLRLQHVVAEQFLPKAEARFLQRKTKLDRVVYSLLRLEDAGLARELYLRINEGESDFAELAARYAEGPERTTRGVVGPVPLMQAHPVLAERLRTGTPGVLMEPFRIEKWWLVVRLETYSPATLDDETAQQMARELFEESVEEAVQQRINDLIPLRFPQA